MGKNNYQKIINRKIKVALIGCGRISGNHIKSILMLHEYAEFIAICDNKEEGINNALELIRSKQEEYNLVKNSPKIYRNFYDFIYSVKKKLIDIDLVVLATPSGMHPKQVIEVANAGMHACTEKPMATKWEDGLEMLEACKDNSVRLFVVKQNRFNSTLQLVKRQIDSGRFGKVALVVVNVFWHRPQSYYDRDDWRGTWKYDGGALMNQASHYIDLLDWLIGPVENVNASIATIGRSIEVEDTASIRIKWGNGALGTMAVTMLTYPKNLEGSITILGEKGTVKVGGPAVNKIEEWKFADKTDDDDKIENANYETTSVYGFGHPIFYENMFRSLQGKEEPICDGEEGLKSLEILIAAYRSSKSHKTIYLPLERNSNQSIIN